MGKTVSLGANVSPVIPSRSFGIMFQLAGTAATQTCRTAASAGVAEAAMNTLSAITPSERAWR